MGIGNENDWVIAYLDHSDWMLPQGINAVKAISFTNVNSTLIIGIDHCGSYCNSNHETVSSQINSIYDYDGSLSLTNRPTLIGSFKTWWNVDANDCVLNTDWNVWYCDWLPSRQIAYLDLVQPGVSDGCDSVLTNLYKPSWCDSGTDPEYGDCSCGSGTGQFAAYSTGYVSQWADNTKQIEMHGWTGVAGISNTGWYWRPYWGSPDYFEIGSEQMQLPRNHFVVLAIKYPSTATFDVEIYSEWESNPAIASPLSQSTKAQVLTNTEILLDPSNYNCTLASSWYSLCPESNSGGFTQTTGGIGPAWHFDGTYLYIRVVNLMCYTDSFKDDCVNGYFEYDNVKIWNVVTGWSYRITATCSGCNVAYSYNSRTYWTTPDVVVPTPFPTTWPTETIEPTPSPTDFPTISPTPNPTYRPTTATPTDSSPITAQPTSKNPTKTPTDTPTMSPSKFPTKSPTSNPTKYPTLNPTKYPTKTPTISPTKYPTESPTVRPTEAPITPGSPTKAPSDPTKTPTTSPTDNPTNIPSLTPTKMPTLVPSNDPSISPTYNPSVSPTLKPTAAPFTPGSPSNAPSDITNDPTQTPSEMPTQYPTTSEPTTSPIITQSTTLSPTVSGPTTICKGDLNIGYDISVIINIDWNVNNTQIIFNCPVNYWCGLGFNAMRMNNRPYTIIINSDLNIYERKIGLYSEGVLLNTSFITSDIVVNGGKTIATLAMKNRFVSDRMVKYIDFIWARSFVNDIIWGNKHEFSGYTMINCSYYSQSPTVSPTTTTTSIPTVSPTIELETTSDDSEDKDKKGKGEKFSVTDVNSYTQTHFLIIGVIGLFLILCIAFSVLCCCLKTRQKNDKLKPQMDTQMNELMPMPFNTKTLYVNEVEHSDADKGPAGTLEDGALPTNTTTTTSEKQDVNDDLLDAFSQHVDENDHGLDI